MVCFDKAHNSFVRLYEASPYQFGGTVHGDDRCPDEGAKYEIGCGPNTNSAEPFTPIVLNLLSPPLKRARIFDGSRTGAKDHGKFPR